MDSVTTSPVTDDRICGALRQVVDPELGINIVDLGLIYGVTIRGGEVAIRMTLTTRGCPLHAVLSQAVERAVRRVPGVTAVHVEMVWEPRWTPDRISSQGRQALTGTGPGAAGE
jgi:metal-sulfur cluster biosynthetic enzyme